MELREAAEEMRSSGEKAVVPFFTAGYPDEGTFLRLVAAASRAGCRLIEIGIPFSDPIADGPAIQAASQAALEKGMTLKKCLALAGEASRGDGTRLVAMGYLNPILRMGAAAFAAAARASGIAGAIIPDLPLEESGEVRRLFAGRGLTLVDLVAPTSGFARMAAIAKGAEGFLYLVSLTGVTGAKSAFGEGLDAFVAAVRERTGLPLYVGFGIASPRDALEAARRADGVIIGSALVRIIRSSRSGPEAAAAVESFLGAVHRRINGRNGSKQS